MTGLLQFPHEVLTPVNGVNVAMTYDTRPGQEATNGMRRSVGLTSAQWRMKFDIMIRDEKTARAARGFFWNMEADSQLVKIALPDVYGIDGPFAVETKASRQEFPKGIPFASDVMFSSGVGHAVPTLEATFAKAASLNDREIYLTVEQELPGGCAISIDEFCHGIAGSWTKDDGSNRVKLSPPLRKAAAIGDVVSLAPVFVGYCVTDKPGYEELTAGLYGTHNLEFVEDLTRLVTSVD